MKDIPIKSGPKEANPFANSRFEVPVRMLPPTKELVNVGTILSPILAPKEVWLDADDYHKVFNNTRVRDTVMRLTGSALSLWIWIGYSLQAGHDNIHINVDLYCKKASVTKRTYQRGIKELLQSSLICSSSISGTYHINPVCLFHGSRVSKYPSNLKYI